MTSTIIDLTPYCSTDDTRMNLHLPWRVGGFVYATDGRIIVRVSADLYPHVAERPEAPKKPTEDKSMFPWDHHHLDVSLWRTPPKDMLLCNHPVCAECKGTGVHKCHQCDNEHECGACHAWGRLGTIGHIDIGPVRLSSLYSYLLCLLPEVELWIDPRNDSIDSVPFRFEGGLGYVMPVRK